METILNMGQQQGTQSAPCLAIVLNAIALNWLNRRLKSLDIGSPR
jgi:hypothetical protein